MSERNIVDTSPPKSKPNVPSAPVCRFAIACEGHEVDLPPGVLILGRGSRCHIVVDDLLASREHARLTVAEDCVVVEDLNSTNGVYVNERRILTPTVIVPGDRVVVGTQELEVIEKDRPHLNPQAMDFKDLAMVLPRPGARSSLLEIDEPGMESPPPPKAESMIATEKADVVTTLGRLADRMLTMGRFDAAERVLQAQLRDVLQGARSGRPLVPEVFEAVVEYALRLAEALHKATWIDYVIEVHMLESRIMEGATIARLTAILPFVGESMNREVFLAYQEFLRSRRNEFSLADRLSCDSILMLELPS